jgi:hypothetical protein
MKQTAAPIITASKHARATAEAAAAEYGTHFVFVCHASQYNRLHSITAQHTTT